jgi:hypothetical protein
MKPLIIAALSALVLNAQAPTKSTTPTTVTDVKAPTLPDSLKAEWWKNVALLQSAQANLQQKQEAVKDTRTKIEAFCNSGDSTVSGDVDGGPTCVLKATPAPAK